MADESRRDEATEGPAEGGVEDSAEEAEGKKREPVSTKRLDLSWLQLETEKPAAEGSEAVDSAPAGDGVAERPQTPLQEPVAATAMIAGERSEEAGDTAPAGASSSVEASGLAGDNPWRAAASADRPPAAEPVPPPPPPPPPQQETRWRREPEPTPEPPAAARPAPEPEPKPEPEPEPEPDFLGRAAEATRRREEELQVERDYSQVVADVQKHVNQGYDLLGLVGYSGSGKTHFLRALSLLLRKQGFELAEFERLRRALVPGFTEASVFDYPATGPRGEKWVFVDAGGELYARLHTNDWTLAESSAALLHSLHHCRGLFLLLHLQQGHFRLSSAGSHRWMDDEQKASDAEIQEAQEELEFFDRFLLFLRALIAEGGDVKKLAILCAEAPSLDRALRSYRESAPKLAIPVMVLFTQADSLASADWEIAPGISLHPRQGNMEVAGLVARHLPELLGTLLNHAERFKFDFVQSYEERAVTDEKGRTLPRWDYDGELLSCGVLPALELLSRTMPPEGGLGRLLRRFELSTRQALKLDRLIHRKRWKGIEVQL